MPGFGHGVFSPLFHGQPFRFYMPSLPVLLLRVSAAWPVPGLGLLALAAGPTPGLAAYPLHTALAVTMALPGEDVFSAVATVEEITRNGTAERALLLDFGAAPTPLLPAGTHLWLEEARPMPSC